MNKQEKADWGKWGPSTGNYINIHSYRKAMVEDEWVLRNAYLELDKEQIDKLDYPVSAGFDPCYAGSDHDGEISKLRELAVYPKVWAIGTVGVDEEAEMDTELQEELLEKQLAIAVEVGKPVLIRLSKNYDDLISYLRKYPVPFILEHFAGNAAQAKELLDHRVWFAFGKAFIHPVSDMHAVIRSIPLSRLFLETGHYTLFNISHAYHHASLLLDKQVDELKEQVFENFVTVFRNTASR